MPKPTFRSSRRPSAQAPTTALSRPRQAATGLLLLLVSAPILAAQNLSTWAGGTGDWLNAGAWTPGGVPGDALSDVVIDNAPATASTVTFGRNDSVGTDLTIGRLRIDTGDTLQFGAAPTTLQFGPAIAFPGAGSLILNGTMSLPWASNTLRGTKSITGSGQLLLGSQGQRPEIYDALTNAATIKGSARIGRATASNPKVTNSGLIEANLSGQDIDFHGQGGVNRSVNTGILKATGGGLMSFGQGEWLNNTPPETISILADGPLSRVAFYRGGLIEGGTISATNGGVVQVGGSFNGENGGATFKNVTLTGPTNLVQELQVNEALTNNGVMTIPSGAQLVNATNSVTISGTGEIKLDAPEDDSPELINQGNSSLPSVPWLFSGVKVRGRGNVGYRQSQGTIDNVAITNQGTFEADVDGQTLQVNVANFDNRSGGLLRATGTGNNALGGVLRLTINGPLKNTGGTIEALNTGRVEAGRVRVEGGLVRNVGGFIDLNGWTLVNPGTGMRLEGEHTLGSLTQPQEATLVGDIENTGLLRIEGGASHARLSVSESANPSVTLRGGGEIRLGHPTVTTRPGQLWDNLDGSFAPRTLTNLDQTIAGYGRIGNTQNDPWLILQNSALVRANVSGQTLSIGLRSATNSGGTFRASGGGLMSLYARDGFNNTGGIIEAFSSGEVSFAAATSVTNGTLKNNAGKFDLANATLINGGAGITLQGPLIIRDTGAAGIVGSILNEGSVRLLNSSDNTRTRLRIGSSGTNSVTLNSPPGNGPGGELILGDPALGGSAASVEAADGTSNPTLTLNQTMRGFGVVGYNSSSTTRSMHLINNAEVNADVDGKQLGLHTLTVLNSPGKSLKATNGGTLYFNPNQLTNNNATISAAATSAIAFDTETTLTGGNVSSAIGGSINVLRNLTANGGVEFTNAGTMNIGSAGGDSLNGLANGGSSIMNSGTVRKLGTTDYSVFSPLNNTGAINVQNGTLRWKAGGQLAGSTISANSNTNLTFQDTPFTFSGANAFSGTGNHWFGNSSVTLANAATTLNVTGNLNIGNYGTTTLTGPGTMNVNAGGTLTIHPGTSNFSGAKLVTQAGSNAVINKNGNPLEFTNGATWENSGMVSMNGSSVLSGASGTRFTNMLGGVFQTTTPQNKSLAMPFDNFGTFEALSGSLSITSTGTFNNGSSKAAAGFGIYASGGTVRFVGGANVSTGDGFFGPWNGNFNFDPNAKLTGENIGLFGTSNLSGAGMLEVTKNLLIGKISEDRFAPSHNITVTSTTLRIAPTATAIFNANISNGPLRLMNQAVFENAGRLEHYFTRSFEGDGTGIFRALNGSTTNFNAEIPGFGYFAEVNVDVPFDIAGIVAAKQGKVVTFTKGGLFNESAKLQVFEASSQFSLTGAAPYKSRGRAVEFNGLGYVNLVGTTLQFEPSTVSTSGNGQLDETRINAGARVAFHGNNLVKSIGTHGTLSSTGLVFQNGDQTVENATLETTGGDTSVWNAAGNKVTFTAGAQFRNTGRFVIQSAVGGPGNPGFTGDAGTRFHNTSTGKLVHDSNTTTQFNIDFQNDGELEFRAGRFEYLKSFTGRGGVAASGGAKVDLPLQNTPVDELPNSLSSTGPNTQLIATLPAGGNLVAAGGGNLVAAGGGNLVAAGGGNLVAAGGGNIAANDAGSRVSTTGGNITADAGGKLVAAGGGNLVAAGGGNLVAAGGGNATATGVGSQLKTDGGNLVAAGGGNLVAAGGGNLVAAGGGNLVAAGGGNVAVTGAASLVNVNNANLNNASLVAAGGGNLVAAGGLNMLGNSLASFTGPVTGANTTGLIGLDGSTLVGLDSASIVAAGGLNAINRSQLIGNDGSTLVAPAGLNAPLPRRGRSGDPTGGPGKIIARTNSLIAGNGTFNGSGFILSGSSLRPGRQALNGPNEVGTMPWNGALEISTGSSLDVQIGGPVAGTDHDRLNVTDTFVLSGNLLVSFVNGFGSGLTPASTFDIVVANDGITAALDGTRVPVTNAYGSFLVSVVNAGTTLRLSDYQTVPATFNRWAQRFGLTGADALPGADPNGSGLTNLMKYALGLDYSASGNAGTATGIFDDGQGGRFLTLSYTKPTGSAAASDLTYEPQRAASATTGPWSGLPADVIPTGPAVPGPGDLETITVRSTHAISPGQPTDFLRLRVVLAPAAP